MGVVVRESAIEREPVAGGEPVVDALRLGVCVCVAVREGLAPYVRLLEGVRVACGQKQMGWPMNACSSQLGGQSEGP